ncbi:MULTISPECIES: hypothetical protein [Moorena]|nr:MULTISPECIES: hypothetical protein [Moorena]NEP68680.1 hypothetical protein [Moorena sp. SIO3A5]OLT65864.1 hypothetical protein BI334_13205 [Moorena producens 3L]
MVSDRVIRIWIASVLVFFVMVEIYQWVRHVTLPLPVFILAGALLAIASNYGKHPGWIFRQPSFPSDSSDANPSQGSQDQDIANTAKLNATKQSLFPTLPLPQKSISFIINRPFEKKDG